MGWAVHRLGTNMPALAQHARAGGAAGTIYSGAADTVVDRLTDLENRLRVGHLRRQARGQVQYNTTRFAQEVATAASNLGEWEDRWWPRNTLPRLAEPVPVPRPAAV
jgi:hypothetical protein